MINKWVLDPAHSELFFKVKHLMITTVTGYFKEFSVEAITETADFSGIKQITFSAEAISVDTNNAQRDEHVRSGEFLDTEKYPTVDFVSTGYEKAGEHFKLFGNLTLKGVSQPVTVDVEFGGIVVDAYGQTKAGFTVSGKISRKAFDLTWGAVTEAGNVVVSDEVRFHAELQLLKQPGIA